MIYALLSPQNLLLHCCVSTGSIKAVCKDHTASRKNLFKIFDLILKNQGNKW